jgi:hypothetical protein
MASIEMAGPRPDKDSPTGPNAKSSRPLTQTGEKRAVKRIVAVWIATDFAWGLILAWSIRRCRRAGT